MFLNRLFIKDIESIILLVHISYNLFQNVHNLTPSHIASKSPSGPWS